MFAAYFDAFCCTHPSAKKYTAELKGWEQAKRPTPLCLGMYEPVVTLMTMNVVMAALQTDDSSHQHWMNQVRTYNLLNNYCCW
jgi:benzoyl-CoA reductase/2-hydroxyglutaryl-CoA dehydratase subunit BcrC/BadD/HgdB